MAEKSFREIVQGHVGEAAGLTEEEVNKAQEKGRKSAEQIAATVKGMKTSGKMKTYEEIKRQVAAMPTKSHPDGRPLEE